MSDFSLLDRRVQQWMYRKGWNALTPVQEKAVRPVLAGDRDVLLSAATAGGKTEAAFFPILSNLLGRGLNGGAGAFVLYVGPLKALINDQFGRVEELCADLDISVTPWHGDVGMGKKNRFAQNPSGILLITPESLEALLVRRGRDAAAMFGSLRYVVIDEMHAFMGTERGRQLQSLLRRVEALLGRGPVPRIGLSATLGNVSDALDFLRPTAELPRSAVVVPAGRFDGDVQLRGFQAVDPNDSADLASIASAVSFADDAVVSSAGSDVGTVDKQVALDLFAELRGLDSLIFAISRRDVETFADLLFRESEQRRVQNQFFPHHGSLSAEIRNDVERRLKDPSARTTAVCTSTLEMGIDIGTVEVVAQIKPPNSVAALRQRMGRSGRRGEASRLLVYVEETPVGVPSNIFDELRSSTLQAVAMIELLGEGWNESPTRGGLHLSTLIQQVLSVLAERGGSTAPSLYRVLCGEGAPFADVSREVFAALLRDMGASVLIEQAPNGLLLLSGAGERVAEHYSFFAAFSTRAEWQLIAPDRKLGTLPVSGVILVDDYLIYAGRRWRVERIDERARIIHVQPSAAGKVPQFPPGVSPRADRIIERMRELYLADDIPSYLDPVAVDLLRQGREAFERFRLRDEQFATISGKTYLFAWAGDVVTDTIALALTAIGVPAQRANLRHFAVEFSSASVDEARAAVRRLVEATPPPPERLAMHIHSRNTEKHDRYLSDALLAAAFAARSLDVPGAWRSMARALGVDGPLRPTRDWVEGALPR